MSENEQNDMSENEQNEIDEFTIQAGCGYSWDHTLRPGDTECHECGAEVGDR